MQQSQYVGPSGDVTTFAEDAGRIWLQRICGIDCIGDGQECPIETRGPAILVTSLGRFEGDAFQLVEQEFPSGAARLVWQVAQGVLRLESLWTFCRETGVVSRKDRLINAGSNNVTIFRVQSRFAFASGRYEVYAQQSRWCCENQGRWLDLHAGGIRFGCTQGRTTQGGTPYLCLREIDAKRGLAFHVVPCGNWAIEAIARPNFSGADLHPLAVIQLGLADADLHRELSPGEAIACPEVLVQALPSGEPSDAAPQLHRWLLGRRFASQRPEMPVVFNTWFDQFEVLELPRLREQLQAAKEVGCEVFVIDAGWYGPQAGDWFVQAGDWREKLDGAFFGKMAAFADEVRAAGLGFGLWMEPERFGPNVPIVKEHLEWFRTGQPPFLRIDLENPAAYAYLRGEILRLVETYRLAWMKIDFNFELGFDGTGAELSGYYEAWYRLLDEVRRKHPETVFEGCASGAMRLDIGCLEHVDGHFLTDTVNPTDVVRIGQGALLRLTPGQLTRWAVVRSIGRTIPRYTKSLADSPISIVTPCAAVWDPSETVELDFVMAATMPGVFGLGGDLAGLTTEAKARVREHVAFFRQHRAMVRRSVAHLLTPPRPKADREGWAALQLGDIESGSALLFVYRLNDGAAAKRFRLKGLDAGASYRLTRYLPSASESATVVGVELMADGVEVVLPGRYQAAIFKLDATGVA